MATAPTPPKAHATHRLLFRGNLSLPDSRLLLDGITFTARLPPSSPSALLKSPLPLALESMRGRPALRLISVVDLQDVHMDWSGEICMYVHPRAIITKAFFERVFCSNAVGSNNLTQRGVRIGLGDIYGPDDESDILVFGRLSQSSTMQLLVGRILPRQAAAKAPRRPRPDDPSPRRPDIFSLRGSPGRRGQKHPHSKDVDAAHVREQKRGKIVLDARASKAKEAMIRLPARLVNGKCDDDARFKMPAPPSKRKNVEDTGPKPRGDVDIPVTFEATNKATIKSLAIEVLNDHGIEKEHPEFKDLYNWCSRGAGFALRKDMASAALDPSDVRRLLDAHANMYVAGDTGM